MRRRKVWCLAVSCSPSPPSWEKAAGWSSPGEGGREEGGRERKGGKSHGLVEERSWKEGGRGGPGVKVTKQSKRERLEEGREREVGVRENEVRICSR